MALILRRTALHGMRTAVPLVLGLELGLYLWALAAAAGFAALVAASEAAYWALKVVGACVLLYLGVRAWLAAWRERRTGGGPAETPVEDRGPGAAKAFAEGLAVSVARAGAWFRPSTVRRRLEAVSGTVLVGLGLRVAASSR